MSTADPGATAWSLPLPPRKNESHGVAKRGNRAWVYVTDVVHDYRRAVAAAIDLRDAMFRGPVTVVVTVFEADRRTDADARVAQLSDALSYANAWTDDAQVCAWSVRRELDAERPRVEVLVTPTDDPALLAACPPRGLITPHKVSTKPKKTPAKPAS